MSSRVKLHVTHVIPPLSVYSERYPGDYFISQSIYDCLILIFPVNDIGINSRRCSWIGNKDQVIHLVICYAIRTIIILEFDRGIFQGAFIDSEDQIVVRISSINLLQVGSNHYACNLRNVQKSYHFILFGIEDNNITVCFGIGIGIKIWVNLLLPVRRWPGMCDK